MVINRYRNICWSLGLATALATSACGGEPGPGEGELAVTMNPLAGGVVATALGVVDFTLPFRPDNPQDLNCTGSMIARNVVLTAAHCFKLGLAGLVAHQTTGSFPTVISYYDPSEGRRTVFDSATDGPATWLSRDYHYDADFPGDANDDIGVVIIPGRFRDTDYHDYKRLYDDLDGPLGNVGAFDDSIFLRAYGAGFFSATQADDNLRRAEFDVENVAPEHIVTDNKTQRVCGGDSGGPLIKVSSTQGQPNSLELVAGINSLHDGEGNCAAQGENSAWCKVSNNLSWIQNTVGLTCTQLLGTSSYRYRRCFPLSFIEDVAFEGDSQSTETAIAVSFL